MKKRLLDVTASQESLSAEVAKTRRRAAAAGIVLLFEQAKSTGSSAA
jgi:hypothetical protein